MLGPSLTRSKYTQTNRTGILAFQMLSLDMPLYVLFLLGFIVASCTSKLAIKGPCILNVLDEFHIDSRGCKNSTLLTMVPSNMTRIIVISVGSYSTKFAGINVFHMLSLHMTTNTDFGSIGVVTKLAGISTTG